MPTGEETEMTSQRTGVQHAPEKHSANAEDTKPTVQSTGKLLLKIGTTTPNHSRKLRQIYRGKIRQISL